MRAPAATLAATLATAWVAACASTPADREPGPPELPGAAAGAPVDERCHEVEALAAAGEHKPAAVALAALTEAGVGCPEPALAAAAASAARWEEADAHLLRAQQSKEAGDLAAARAAYRQALEVYPRYYWASRLLARLEETIQARAVELAATAAAARDAGDLQAELEARSAAAALDPADPAPAADLARLRRQLAEKNLSLARHAEQLGDLAEAGRRLEQALTAGPITDPDLRQGLVDYARLLGLRFFSDGDLTRAREVWTRALALDDANEKLREYLRQVEERLLSLGRIQHEDGGTPPR